MARYNIFDSNSKEVTHNFIILYRPTNTVGKRVQINKLIVFKLTLG